MDEACERRGASLPSFGTELTPPEDTAQSPESQDGRAGRRKTLQPAEWGVGVGVGREPRPSETVPQTHGFASTARGRPRSTFHRPRHGR